MMLNRKQLNALCRQIIGPQGGYLFTKSLNSFFHYKIVQIKGEESIFPNAEGTKIV